MTTIRAFDVASGAQIYESARLGCTPIIPIVLAFVTASVHQAWSCLIALECELMGFPSMKTAIAG